MRLGWLGYLFFTFTLGLTVAVLANVEDLDTQKMAYEITDIILTQSTEFHDDHD